MANGILRRIYRVRPLSASILCLPSLLIAVWYAWNAHERFDTARRLEGDDVALTVETYQIHLHDLLKRDLRRMTMGPPPDRSRLDSFTFSVDQEEMDRLERGVERDSGRDYAKAKLVYDGKTYKVELRLRGQRYWHLGVEQKSLKVKLPKGELLDDHRVFNLINDPSPMVIGEHLILDLARTRGILTPKASFARVRMNATDLGVFQYETQPDESLLRTNSRVPGSIYSGDLTSKGDSWELWKSSKPWKKPASSTDDEAVKEDFTELDRLLKMVRSASYRQFDDFVRHEVDMERFAAFDAIDVAFGGNRHNFRQNQKYAFDPYRGRWEPIAWSFEGFRDDPNFNLVEYPFLIRLKMTPGYLMRRNRLLYEFLVGEGSYPSLQRRGIRTLVDLAPELRTDPFWDAYRLLSRVDEYHRKMVRPMTMQRAILVFQSELVTYRQRARQLMRALEKNPLFVRWSPRPTDEAGDAAEPAEGAESAEQGRPVESNKVLTKLELFISGDAGANLERVRVALAKDCASNDVRLLKGEQVLAVATLPDDLELEQLPLVPAVSIVTQVDSGGSEGDIRSEAIPERYELTVESACPVETVEVEAVHMVTQSRIVGQPVPEDLPARVPQTRPAADDVAEFEPGEIAPHAWDLLPPPAERVTLGPGEVEVAESRVFGAHERVEVLPGTRIKMGPKASMVFLGPVNFRGTRGKPIEIVRATGAPWGGIALQGPETEGSRFSFVTASGGSTPSWRLVKYPAMVNVHDTRDILIQNSHFKENVGQGDVVHVAYVDDLDVSDSVVSAASNDAWDLEFVEGKLRRTSAVNVGDDGLDLMASHVEIADCMLVGITGNGVSAGEESRVTIRHSVVSDAKVGVLAKNASSVDVFGALLFRNNTGVRVYQRTVRYAGDSSVNADDLFCVQTKKKLVRRDDKKKNVLDHGQARSGFPPTGVLDTVLKDLLGIDDWAELGTWSKTRRNGGVL